MSRHRGGYPLLRPETMRKPSAIVLGMDEKWQSYVEGINENIMSVQCSTAWSRAGIATPIAPVAGRRL